MSMSASVTHVPMVVTAPTRSMDTSVLANQGRRASTVKRVSSLRTYSGKLKKGISADIRRKNNVIIPSKRTATRRRFNVIMTLLLCAPCPLGCRLPPIAGNITIHSRQATGLDAWASRVKCPARFVLHLHDIYIYIWVVYSLCFFCCLFITVTWWYVWCFEWASGNQEEVQACLVTLWLFIISCYSLYNTTLGLLCSWFENNPHFHKYSMDFHV